MTELYDEAAYYKNIQEKETPSLLIEESAIIKRTIKDSIFTNLFKDKKYLLQLYQAIHPEDMKTTEQDLKDVSINNVLVDDIYNDLGFSVGDKLLILLEAQSTWTVNILFRVLMYLVQTYREYFRLTEQDIYNSTKLKMPKPELYIIYTGNRKAQPAEISFAQEFFNGENVCIDVKAKVLYDGKKGDIISQYVSFTKICNTQVSVYGRTKTAIQKAIRICKDQNVLKEYLKSREKEVVDMMMELYDQEEVMRSYLKSKVREAVDEAVRDTEYDTKIETAKRLLQLGKLSMEEIALGSGLTVEEVQKLV